MYEKCLKCNHLGRDCFPNLYVMPVEDMREFAIKLKKERNLSNAKISKISGISKGTIDSSFSNKDGDIHYTTFAPILCTLLQSDWEESPCPQFIVNSDKDNETIERLEKENAELKAKNIEDTQYLKRAIKTKNTAIIILGTVLFIALVVIIAALAIDRYNSGLGFLWVSH